MVIKGKKFLVVGLGVSGAAAARFLKKRGASVTVTDKAKEEDICPLAGEMRKMGIKLELGRHKIDSFENSDVIIISPGVSDTIEPIKRAKEKGINVIGEIELASRFIKEPVVAITGTNGKTTTTELLAEMLEYSGFNLFVGGNIGNPLIEYLDKNNRAEIVVAEISSFQLDTINTFRPKVAVLLNITEDHLDRYPDFEAYAQAKAKIFKNQQNEDIAVLNGADRFIRLMTENIKSQKCFFNFHNANEKGAAITGENLVVDISGGQKYFFDLSSINLFGGHNMENIAAACLGALAAGGTIGGIEKALRNFKGLSHRLEYITSINNVKYFNDSKATNVDAVSKAIESFSRPIILIMGGRCKGGNYDILGDQIRRNIKKLILIGEAGETIKSALQHKCKGGIKSADTMEEAVFFANQAASPGDIVLLSPACSSFDMYRSYAERGEIFCKAVAILRETDDRQKR